MQKNKNKRDKLNNSKKDFLNRLDQRLSKVTYSIFLNNIVGRLTYCVLIALEFIVLGFILIVTSHPDFKKRDILDTQDVLIIWTNSSLALILALSTILYFIMLIALLIMVRLMLTKGNYEEMKETSFIKRMFSGYIALQRTIMTYIMIILFVTGINLKLKSSDQDQNLKYALIFLSIVGGSIYILSMLISFALFHLPMPMQNVPWACSNQRSLNLMELLKIVVTTQDLFMGTLRKSQIGQAAYFLLILTCIAFLNIQTPNFYDVRVDKVYKLASRITLSLTITCLMRIAFKFQILEVIIYFFPISYALYSFLDWFEYKNHLKLVNLIYSKDKLDSHKISSIIQFMLLMLERQDTSDLKILLQILNSHRLQCFNEKCICIHYKYILLTKLKEKDDSRKATQLRPIDSQQDGMNTMISEIQKQGLPTVQDFMNIDTLAFQIEIEEQNSNPGSFPNRRVNFLDQDQQINQQDQNQKYGQSMYNCDIQAEFNIQDLFRHLVEIEETNQKMNDSFKTQQVVSSQVTDYQDFEALRFLNQKEARKYFFLWLLETLLKGIEKNQNNQNLIDNVQYQMLYIYFINSCLQKSFLAIFQLLQMNRNKKQMNFIDKITFKTGEQLILKDAMQSFKNNSDGFDYSYFIESNHQQVELDNQYESTTREIIEFWKKWRIEGSKIEAILNTGTEISQNVAQIKQLTKKLEESQVFKMDILRYQIYALFFLEILHDPITSSSMAINIKNAVAYKGKNKFFGQLGNGNENSLRFQQQMLSEIGLCMVSAWGSKRNSWEFLYGNKQFSEMFKLQENQFIGQSINCIIPKIIAEQHDVIVKRFFSEGKPKSLGQLRLLFGKDMDGYIFPLSLRLNFFYHQKFSYTFIAQFEKARFTNLYQEEQNKIPTEDVMYFLCDNDLNISDISKNVLNFSGMNKEAYRQIEENNGRKLSLSVFISDIENILTVEFGSTVLPTRYNIGLANKIVYFKKYDSVLDRISDSLTFPCVLTYYSIIVPSLIDNVRVNVFQLIPIHKCPDFEAQLTQQSSKNYISGFHNYSSANFNKKSFTSVLVKTSSGQTKQDPQQLHNVNSQAFTLGSDDSQVKGAKNDFYEGINSMSSTSSSTNSSSVQAHYAKNLLFLNKSPKVLKINVFITIGMIVAFYIISIYNLSIFLSKYTEIQDRLTIFSHIAQRNANIRAVCLNLKMMHQIVQNPQKYNQSLVLPENESRLDFYYKDLKENLQIVMESTDNFYQFLLLNNDDYGFRIVFEGLSFITENGYIYKESFQLKHSLKLFISYADSIDLKDLINQKPPLNVTGYAKNYSENLNEYYFKDKKISSLDQSLFFLFENGMYKMAELGLLQKSLLIKAANDQSARSQDTLNITTFVSIGIVSLIGIIIFPLLTRFFDKQYEVVRFFNNLDAEVTESCLERGLQYQRILNEKMGEKQKTISSKSLSQDEENNQESTYIKTQKKIHQMIMQNQKKQQDRLIKKGELQNTLKKQPKNHKKQLDELDHEKQDQVHMKKLPKFEEEEEKEESSSNEPNDHTHHSDFQTHDDLKNFKKGDDIRIQIELNKSRQRSIMNQITKLQFTNKIKLFIAVVILVLYLNSSLIISFFQTQVIFQNDKDSLTQLNHFLRREECAYNLILFMRERIIRNQTLEIIFYDSDGKEMIKPAVGFYVDLCISNEDTVNKIRKSAPTYLKEAQDELNRFESDKICQDSYPNNQNKAHNCISSLDGIMHQGLGHALQQIISYIQTTNIKFDAYKDRNLTVLKELLDQQKMHEFSDLSLYYLKDSFERLQYLLRMTALQYFQAAKSSYLLVFGIFMALTGIITIILGFIIFWKVKRRILDVQNILVLIPLDELQVNLRQKIENYLLK